MNWEYADTDFQATKTTDPKWYLERCILYGLPKGEKLPEAMLKKYLPELNIPEERRHFLQFLLDD